MSSGVKWTAAAMAVAAGVFALWSFFFRDTTTPVQRGDIVATTIPGAEAPGDPGVYRYVTSGFEEIDALGGARHDYPAETFVTIRAEGCGFVARWDALAERWTEWALCDAPEGLTLDTLTSFHKWYGQNNLEPYPCDDASLLVPAAASGGATSFVCRKGETVETYEAAFIGTESIVVDGTALDTVHVLLTSTIEGTTTGIASVDMWWLAGKPLPIRFVVERDNTTESAVGAVDYTERYEINLVSPVPEG